MTRPHLGVVALLLACAATNPSETTDSDGAAEGTTGSSGVSTGVGEDTSASASTTGASSSETGSVGETGSGSEGEGTDTGPEPPLPDGICNDDGECSFPETCSTCPDECGSCDVADYPNQQAKYVDQACATAGDGLIDRCAASDGGPGRFDDLQVALDSLVGGDTLYVHPGDYFRAGEPFVFAGSGTQEAPIFVTAAAPDNPPVIHSWDPAEPENNAASHEAIVGGGEYVVLDGVIVEGLVIFSGEHTRIQNVECRHGWEECDGNWSCLRLEWCTDCNAHHNWVHDVFDTTAQCTGGPYAPREAGLKEFDGVRDIWEFNTIENTAQWGYDLHRSSTDPVARFNLFRNIPNTAIRMNRSANIHAYGNVVLGAGECIGYINEDAGDGFANVLDHNTCLFAQSGAGINPWSPTTVTNNVFGGLAPSGSEQVNLAAPPAEDGVPHTIDHNAYDAGSWWATILYETYAETLAGWQELTDYDEHSIAAPGGACTFVDAPSDADDTDFDLTIEDGECATLSDSAEPIGACAITACVGHDCAACGF